MKEIHSKGMIKCKSDISQPTIKTKLEYANTLVVMNPSQNAFSVFDVVLYVKKKISGQCWR